MKLRQRFGVGFDSRAAIKSLVAQRGIEHRVVTCDDDIDDDPAIETLLDTAESDLL